MRRALLAALATLCACGSGPGTSVTDQGHTLNPKSGLVAQQQGGSAILIADASGLCQTLTNVNPCDPSSLGSSLSALTALSLVVTGVAPGTYSIGGIQGGADAGFDPTHVAQAQFISTSGALVDTATSGTVTLTTLSAGGSAQGSYDLMMQKGDHLTGSFNAEFCPGLSNLESSGPICNDDTSSQTSCSNTCTCGGKTVKAACTENADSSFDCTCTSASGSTSTCHATNVDSFVACERDFGCCPFTF